VVVGALLAALGLRLAYVASLPHQLDFVEPLYNDLVTNLLTGQGYCFSPPLGRPLPLHPLRLPRVRNLLKVRCGISTRTKRDMKPPVKASSGSRQAGRPRCCQVPRRTPSRLF
jgi:hypothetical protein